MVLDHLEEPKWPYTQSEGHHAHGHPDVSKQSKRQGATRENGGDQESRQP